MSKRGPYDCASHRGERRPQLTSEVFPERVYECRACRKRIVLWENPRRPRPEPRTLCAECLARTFARARLH